MKKTISTVISCLTCMSLSHAKVTLTQIGPKFQKPLVLSHPKGGFKYLAIAEQAGKVWWLDPSTGERKETALIDISEKVGTRYVEMGLLGMTFDPDFTKTGIFYLHYTDKECVSQLVRFKADLKTLTAKPEEGETLLSLKQPHDNHNGGWIDFGPDGMLYLAWGDGGAQNDPQNMAQNLNSWFGKILRLDVSVSKGYKVPSDNPFVGKAGTKPEIFCYGLRNPWRCSFDRKNGDFFIGDVGQDKNEEINHVTFKAAKGANFGWRLREGFAATSAKEVGGDKPKDSIDPIYDYSHGGGPNQGVSVTGGFVHRGSVASLQGRYVFADYQRGRVWSIKSSGNGSAGTDFKDMSEEIQPADGRVQLPTSFGEDNAGNLYLLDHLGGVYRFDEK